MRLLYLCSDHGIPAMGTKGASIHLQAITRALCDLGHTVQLATRTAGLKRRCRPDSDTDDDPQSGLKAACRPRSGFKRLRRHPAENILSSIGSSSASRVSKKLKRWLNERSFESGVASEFRSLADNEWMVDHIQAALGDSPPDAFIERLSLFGHAGLDLAGIYNRPLILEVNALLSDEARRFRSLQLHALAKEVERRVFARADRIITVSTALAQRLAAQGVDASRITVIPNGADPDLFINLPSRQECKSRLGLAGKFVIGFCGSLKPWHGVDVLVDAFSRLAGGTAALTRCAGVDQPIHLLIVGTGSNESKIREQVIRLNLTDKVTLTGARPHQAVPELLCAMDVAVAPFRSVDGFYFSPIKLFEYMAAGTCVVASKLGQITEIIEEGHTGLLCPPDDADALADTIRRVQTSSTLRERIGKAARTAQRQYTWEHAARRTMEVVESAINEYDQTKNQKRFQGVGSCCCLNETLKTEKTVPSARATGS